MIFKFINKIYARGFFVGHLPVAPGTWGSLLALVLLWFFPQVFLNKWLIIILFFIGVFSSNYEEVNTHISDDGRIVIDEIIGLFITFIGIPLKPWLMFSGFLFFRFFDIIKPLGINQSQKLPGGWGVMADDVLAGIFSNLILQILLRIYG
ncbi:MAG: phosphatidylglycerophosphatase A [Halanaerobiaceae bacterium]